jgi:hypothetical protein
MGCDRRTVIRSIKRLEEIGLIVKQQRTKNNKNLTNRYYVNFNNPMVTHESPLVVTLETLGSVTGDTTSSVTGDTQSRVYNKSKFNKKGKISTQVDQRLEDEETF